MSDQQETPRWLKLLVRERMERTGENYTRALREIRKEQAAALRERGDG